MKLLNFLTKSIRLLARDLGKIELKRGNKGTKKFLPSYSVNGIPFADSMSGRIRYPELLYRLAQKWRT